MIKKIANAIRYISLAKVADDPKDKKVLTEAAAELMDQISNAYIRNSDILKPLERMSKKTHAFEDDMEDFEDDDLDEELEDFEDEEDDLIDTEVVDEFEEPMIAEDEEDDDDVIVVEEDEDSDQENIDDDEEEDEEEEEESEESESDEEDTEKSEASYVPRSTRRKAIATANRLAATGDKATQKLAANIIRRIVQ